MSKHTPGPWPRIQGIDHTAATVSTESGITVATVYGHDLETTKANARLIAAAPELLAALELSEKFVAKFEEDDDYTDGQVETLYAIRAAIAKAVSG